MSIKFITIIKAGAIAICLASFAAQAGIASRIAAEVAPVIGSKVSRKAIHEQNKDKPTVSEFDRLANAIPANLTEKQGKSASVLISVVYRHRLGDALPPDQRVSRSDFKTLTTRFSEKVSKADKISIEPVIKLHMFCQRQTELYIESLLPNSQEQASREASQNEYRDNLKRCSAKMDQLPGVPSDFSTGYSEVLKKFESSDVKAGLKALRPGDSTLANVSLMVKGLKSVREQMDNDFRSIFR
jgi:hypothetical protein